MVSNSEENILYIFVRGDVIFLHIKKYISFFLRLGINKKIKYLYINIVKILKFFEINII